MNKVDFGYAFAAPHVITLSRPSGSDKTIVMVDKSCIGIKWTWQNLKDKFPLSWTIMKADVTMNLTVSVNGERAEFSFWRRADGGVPMPVVEGSRGNVSYTVRAVSSKLGDVFELSIANNAEKDNNVSFDLEHTNGWVVSNKGFIDGINSNVLLTLNDGRADRIIAYACGADEYPVVRNGKNAITGVPMSNAEYSKSENPAKTLSMFFRMGAGETKRAYFIRPYESYFEEKEKFDKLDLSRLFYEGEAEWKKLLARGMQISVPDKGVEDGFKSCLADLFVMREKLAGKYWGIVCGTDIYRSVNASEPAMSDLLLEQLGYEKESLQDIRVHLDGQDESGCWVTSKGWEHDVWYIIYHKALLVMNHYYISGDREFLAKYYENMKKSSLWNGKMREQNRKDPSSPSYGLMPRGMGDAGLMNNSDYYGYFYPHNCMSVAADGLTVKAAEILGKKEDLKILTEIYESAKRDIIKSMRENSVKESDYEWIPGTFNAETTSLFGCLSSYYPCGILDKDDPLIKGTLRRVEEKGISEGGLPVGTGWLKDGLWVAMALDNFSAAYLEMERYDDAAKFLYPVLNHASPFVTWCEERGVEPGSAVKTGDWQHLWTPLSVGRYVRDALINEKKGALNILCGIPREWLADGCEISVKGAVTYLGKIDFAAKRTRNKLVLRLKSDKDLQRVILHLRLPEKDKKFVCSACKFDGEKAIFENIGTTLKVEIEII